MSHSLFGFGLARFVPRMEYDLLNPEALTLRWLRLVLPGSQAGRAGRAKVAGVKPMAAVEAGTALAEPG